MASKLATVLVSLPTYYNPDKAGTLLEVDIPDTKENRGWFEEWARDTLLARFRQDAIYIRFYGSGRRMAAVIVIRPEKAGR